MAIISLLFGLVMFAAFLAIAILWVYSIYLAASREDLKQDKLLWLLLILLVVPIGSLIFYFVEDQKREGIIMVLACAAPFVMLPLWAIFSFLTASFS
jgi:O-antigen ligase